jgi:hypothetical protein
VLQQGPIHGERARALLDFRRASSAPARRAMHRRHGVAHALRTPDGRRRAQVREHVPAPVLRPAAVAVVAGRHQRVAVVHAAVVALAFVLALVASP